MIPIMKAHKTHMQSYFSNRTIIKLANYKEKHLLLNCPIKISKNPICPDNSTGI